MEEEATQPGIKPRTSFVEKSGWHEANDNHLLATQLVIDPRRLGHHNSGLNDDDLTDIFCILHPASMSACIAAALIAKENPEHTISNTGVELKVRGGSKNLVKPPTTSDLAAQGVASRDIALRLSASLKDPLLGFLFGRNPDRCDFVIAGTEGAKRISNVHFRIYLNEHGILMLEDHSTNGTQVENVMLRARMKENGEQYRHTLVQGSLITLVMTPPDEDIRFVVRIPQREGEYEAIYNENLQRYFQRWQHIQQTRVVERGAAAAKANGKTGGIHKGPPDIFGHVTKRAASVGAPAPSKEWRGGATYNKVGLAGKGAFANVYKMSHKYDGTLYAAKELEKRRFMKNGVLDQKVDMEIKIMRKIDHPHVVKFIEAVDWEDYIYLIMEYVPHKDLGHLMNDRSKLDEDTVKLMAGQLLSALKYLHEKGITHRDVKPDNILIQSYDPLHVKLTDFGLSKMVEEEETFLRTFCGTLLYCAPEVYTEYREYDSGGNRTLRGKDKKSLPQQRYDHAVDIWSLGSVLFYALCGSPPYPAKSNTGYHELLNSIMTKPLDVRPLQKAGVSEAGLGFVRAMLQVNPHQRATIEQLEASSWLGDGSMIMSVDDDDDEVDLVGGDNTVLEEGASQLNIHDGNDYDNDDDQDLETEIAGPYLTSSGRMIPSSFRSGDSMSSESESFAFIRNSPGNPRLFGEVNASALGSSGVIPQDRLNLPISASVSEGDILDSASNLNFSTMDTENPPPPVTLTMDGEELTQAAAAVSGSTTEPTEQEGSNSLPLDTIMSAPSLMGAESMVGQLQMDEPSPLLIVRSNGPPTPEIHDPTISLRRPRDDTPPEDARPSIKRLKSSREIDIPLSKTVFWDEKNKSTWHNDYPEMMLSQYTEAKDVAKAHGEQFKHGETIFEKYVGSYRKTPSEEPEPQVRAHSEPAVGQGRQALMKRDERKLEAITGTQVPSASRSESMILTGLSDKQLADQVQRVEAMNVPNKDLTFKPPKRILGKLIATPDSVLPSISLNITDPFMSWGRGYTNTIVFPDGYEDRIPKYAFKLMLWKRGLSATGNQPLEPDMSFWISTKATMGIRINGVLLKSHDCKQAGSPSKDWGELRHGDEITIWTRENKTHLFMKLRFECYYGASSSARAEDAPRFNIIPRGEISDELDQFCLQRENDHKTQSGKSKAASEEKENARETGFQTENFRPVPFLAD